MRNRNTLLALTALAAALCALACSDSNVNGKGGQVRVMLASPTAAAQTAATTSGDRDHDRRIKGIEIEVSDLLARSATKQVLESVSLDLPRTVDLLALLENGGQVDLGVGSLPPDMYDQLVVVVSSLTLTAIDDTEIKITPPGGGWTRIVRVEPFEVVDGAITTIVIKIRPRFLFGEDDDIHDVDAGDLDLNVDAEVDD